MASLTIGIIGNGFVGRATSLFAGPFVKVLVYDIDPEKCVPLGTSLSVIAYSCDLIFVCVPTPIEMTSNKCHLGFVESAIESLRQNRPFGSIVLRSTVPPGTCYNLGVHHFPEFLRERTWNIDFQETSKWVIGECKNKTLVNQNDVNLFNSRMVQLLKHATRDKQIGGSDIYWATTDESELVKYSRNAFLATKLSFFNEIESFARADKITFLYLHSQSN